MTIEERAKAAECAANALIDALSAAGVTDCPDICCIALGAVLGAMAQASGNPAEMIAMTTDIARGLAS